MAEFLINYTIKHILRIENNGHYEIAKQLQWAIREYDWGLDDNIELVFYDRCDTRAIAKLILNDNYRISGDDEKCFVF